jgi:hypothetical protein
VVRIGPTSTSVRSDRSATSPTVTTTRGDNTVRAARLTGVVPRAGVDSPPTHSGSAVCRGSSRERIARRLQRASGDRASSGYEPAASLLWLWLPSDVSVAVGSDSAPSVLSTISVVGTSFTNQKHKFFARRVLESCRHRRP